VIHAMHHEQDMRFYGGLRKQIPITFWVMMAGTLAITGVGIPGILGLPQIGFAGFHSKDGILELAYASGRGTGAFWVGVLAALLTSFYSWRVMFLTFWGKPRWINSEHIQHALHDHGHHGDVEETEDTTAHPHVHERGAPELAAGTGGYHPHESPLTMLVPIVALAIGAIAAGFAFQHVFIDPTAGDSYWRGAIAFNEHLYHAAHEVPVGIKLSATIVMLLGLWGAWLAYIRRPDIPARFTGTFGAIYGFVLNKWYFDELYNLLFVRPAFAIGRLFWKGGDEGTIDRFGPNGSAWVVAFGSRVAGRLQSGYVYTYAFVMLIGLTAAITWAIGR
ncbi:MAG: NADH-quinone oxidoreductase subunit L, partial [Proteobacteria bacterium]|nr:NADH-quinone oxidoreductase subunit L [Pseudomonadota bacterium]